MVYLSSNGYRCIVHDSCGYGRSSQPWNGNETDTNADDLSELIETLDLNGATDGTTMPGAKVSQGVRDAFWFQGMQGGLKNGLDCIKALGFYVTI
jgi:hypothetical protein